MDYRLLELGTLEKKLGEFTFVHFEFTMGHPSMDSSRQVLKGIVWPRDVNLGTREYSNRNQEVEVIKRISTEQKMDLRGKRN